MASTPAYSPDGAVLLAGVGDATGTVTHTHDASLAGLTLPAPQLVAHYPEFFVPGTDPVLSPRLSPDGTRLALRTRQLHAARWNMSLPPRITAVGGRPVPDATPFVDLATSAGGWLQLGVEADDPEGDPVALAACFLEDGMGFDAAARTFWWAPPDSAAGRAYAVRFQATTPSGGTDYAIARIAVGAPVGVGGQERPARFALHPGEPSPFAGRTTLRFELEQPGPARLEVFDAAGRRVRRLLARALPAGAHLAQWDGRDDAGRRLPAGVYLCRLASGSRRAEVRLVLLP